MSVNGKARDSPTLAQEILNLKKQIQFLNSRLRERGGFPSVETKPIGTAGGTSGAPGPAGFLKTEGDTMIGPIAFFPKLQAIDTTDNSLNLARELGEAFSSRVIVSTTGGGTQIDTIHGAAHAGQLLIIQGIITETFTIKDGLGNIRGFDGGDIVIVDNQNVWLVFDAIANEWAAIGGSGGAGTGTNISAALNADQVANLAVGNHIEFDNNVPPLGHDGGIVLQTGAGQADGIFELKAGKTYFLSAAIKPLFAIGANRVEFVWYDITNTQELGLRSVYDDTAPAGITINDQPKDEIIVTPATDITVEVRIAAVTTPANFVGISADYTFAHIFEFSGINGSDGIDGAGTKNWKDSVRAKTLVDVPNLAAFNVITDGVTLIQNDRVLLTEQATASENGIYDVGVVAAGLAPLTRSLDLDASAELVASIFVPVEEGTTKKDTLWQLTSDNPLTIGASSQVWKEFSGAVLDIPGAGADGKDASGTFILDGRIFAGYDKLKEWEIISDFAYPNNGTKAMIYLPSVFSPAAPGRLVMVGDSTQAKNSSYSDNYGTTWQHGAGPISSNDNYTNLAYDPTGNVLVAISSNSPNAARAIQRSTDRGANWSNTAYAGSLLLTDLIWSEADSLFIIVDATATTTNRIWTSPDGNTWTQRITPAATVGGWRKIVYHAALGKYFVYNTGTEVMESTDAITWNAVGPTSLSLAGLDKLTYSPGQEKIMGLAPFGGPGSLGVHVSIDGINWTKNIIPNAGDVKDIVWASDLSLWVVLGSDTTALSVTPRIFHASNDAENWFDMPVNNFRNPDSSAVASVKSAIVYAEEFGYFFACNNTVTSGSPFTANADLYRTRVSFNDVI